MTTPNDDPFTGPLAGITGRLQKLRDVEMGPIMSGDLSVEQKVDRLVFVSGMLIDLMDELAQRLVDVMPEGGSDGNG